MKSCYHYLHSQLVFLVQRTVCATPLNVTFTTVTR